MKLNSYKGIADRYFFRNKKRSILNIIAISLAIGLFVSIATFVKSSEETQLNSMKRDSGDFEVSFNDIPSDKVKTLLDNVELDNQGVAELKKILPIDDTNENIELCKYDDKTINDIYTFNLLEGRLPEKDNEIVITEKTRDTVENMKLGNKVKINNVEYEVVGVKTENQYSKNNPNAAFTYLDRENINPESRYSVLCKTKESSNKVDLAKKIAKNLGLEEDVVGGNTRIIMMVDTGEENSSSNVMYYFVVIVYVIIIISTVAVIYNSFNISVTEKISQYGMLRAVGSAPNQIRYLVLKEGILSWLFALPIGIVGGIGALKLVIYIIISTMKSGTVAFAMDINIYPKAILLSAIISLVSVIISVLGPAIMAGKVSIIETIKNPGNLNIKTQKIKKRKSRISSLLFGFEGELAYKNVKRNNKRFIITVISLMLSLLMFNTFTSLVSGLQGGVESIMGQVNYDGEMVFQDAQNRASVDLIDDIKNIDGIKYACTWKEDYNDYNILIEKDKFNEKYLEKYKEKSKKDAVTEKDEKYETKFYAVGIGKEGVNYIKENIKDKLDIDKIEDNEIILVNPNEITPGSLSEERMLNYKVGDKINIPQYIDGEKEDKEFKVAGIIDKNPGRPYVIAGSIDVILTEKAYDEMLNASANGIIISHKEGFEAENNREKLQKIAEDNDGVYTDMAEIKDQNNEVLLQIGIFAYGFIAVITIISIVNIINTVSMSIITRKKEFGIIKAIGMHQGQLSKMISIEGVLSGLYAAVFGSILSLFIMKAIVSMYSEQVGLSLNTPYWIVLVSGLAVVLITYVAALIPLKKLKNINLVESIKEE